MRIPMVITMMAAAMVAGCNTVLPDPTGGGGAGDTAKAGLERFASQEELLRYFRDQARLRYPVPEPPGLFDFFPTLIEPMGFDMAAGGDVRSDDSAPQGGAAPEAGDGNALAADDFSGTNLQEAGVDESDIVKTDGKYFYILSHGLLRIVRINTADEALAEVATLEFAGGYPDSMFLRDGEVIALTTSGGYYCCYDDDFGDVMMDGPMPLKEEPVAPGEWRPERATVSIHLIDVSDPTAPAVTRSFDFEGSLVTSRMIRSKLHVIVSAEPYLPYGVEVGDIERMELAEWMPDYRRNAGDETATGDMLDWSDVYRPTNPNGYGITGVVTLDVDDPEAGFQAVAVVADAGTVYASTESLYITDTDYSWDFTSERTTTAIHKLDLTGDEVVYVASGSVKGRLLNQFSLSEYQDHLRVATTSEDQPDAPPNPLQDMFAPDIWIPPTLSNNVYVLGVSDGDLTVTGKIEDIAPGEEIYSARFLGTRGFLVTFVRVDPLFTLDLSDPAAPKIVGELKIPGYSDYIHPFGENHLLTIGKDADEESGLYQGVQLSVFDVTDFANPTLLHKQLIGTRGTDSEALYNHKAFTYFAPKDLLAIPISLYEGGGQTPWDYGAYTFAGLYVYEVTVEGGFNLRGRMSTRSQANGDWWGPTFTRGIVVGDSIYAVTDESVRGAPIADEIPGAEWALDFQDASQ